MTGYALEGELEKWMVRGHDAAGAEAPYYFGTEAINGAGGLRSNAEDMLTFLEANLGPPTNELEHAMRTAQEDRRSRGDRADSIGLGWISWILNGRRLVRHSGGTGGFSAEVVLDPERGVGAVILSNSDQYDNILATDLVVHDPVDPDRAVEVDPGLLGTYAGAYFSEGGRPLHVRLEEEGFLTVQPAGEVRMRLYPRSDSSFFTMREEWTIRFRQGIEGDPMEILLETGDRSNRFAKSADSSPLPAVVAGNRAAALSAAVIAAYEGTYMLELGGRPVPLRIFAESGQLIAELDGGRAVSRLIPRDAEHEFTIATRPSDRILFTVEDGRAVRLTLFQAGRPTVGVRNR